MYVPCISHVRNNLHMPSIFVEKHTTIHKVICHFTNCNIDSRINVDHISIHPNIYSVYITISTIGSYSITNKSNKANIEKTSAIVASRDQANSRASSNVASRDLCLYQNRNFLQCWDISN